MTDGDFNEALRAYLTDDFATALALWVPQARSGHGPSAYRVGYMHETGQGVERDPTAAAGWYERAAEAGDVDAMAALGALLLHGIGVPQDMARAYLWLSLAVAKGAHAAMPLRDRAASRLSRDQLAEVENEARRRFLRLGDAT